MTSKILTRYALGGVAAGALLVGIATGANADSQTGTANAAIKAALDITATAAMDYGDIGPNQLASTTVIIDPGTGARTGTAALFATDAGNRGTFTLAGDNSRSYNIDTSDTGVTLSGTGSDMSATVTYFSGTANAVISPSAGSVSSLSAGGADTVGFGGTLTVGVNQTAGAYTGTFTFLANYD